ncbi:MAG TPA: redoxin domain-containing protein [Reyranella sp.]|nr:redoxin domain-containing protein [Reyranella sp.]
MQNAPRALQIGQMAPDFEQDTTNGSVRFHQWIGRSWCVLFSYPKNLEATSVAELAQAAALKPEWALRAVKVIGLCIDTSDEQARWQRQVQEAQGFLPNFPVITDTDRSVSVLYGTVRRDDPYHIVRRVFVIDPYKKIRLMRTNPSSIGCDFHGILHAIDRLQRIDGLKPLLPAGASRPAGMGYGVAGLRF